MALTRDEKMVTGFESYGVQDEDIVVRNTVSNTDEEHEQGADHSHDTASETSGSGCIAI